MSNRAQITVSLHQRRRSGHTVPSARPAETLRQVETRHNLPSSLSSFIGRGRDIAEVRLEPAFHHIHKEIWASLKVEVQKAYAAGGVG